MTKSRTWLALCLAVVALGGVAIAQPSNLATNLLNSPVKTEFSGFGPTLVRSAPWAGSACFGLCEDLTDNTLYGTDLFTAQIYQYDKGLNLLGNIPGVTGTMTGIAYDHLADSFWVIQVGTRLLIELDKTGTPTGNTVSIVATGGTVPGPLTIDPSAGVVTYWLEDIALDAAFQVDAAGTILNTHPNPEGTGVYGNGLSYDAFDAGPQPQNLHITSGLGSEFQVMRIWQGQPSAGVPRPYVKILEVGNFDTFINGIQNTTDATANPTEVWYMQGNASNVLLEVNDVPFPPIIQCAPGGVNLGTPLSGVVFSDDMEAGGAANWSHGAVLGIDDWAVSTQPNAHSGTQAWRCIDDQTYTDKHLDLTIDINAPATLLTFWHTYYWEAPAYDGGIMEISVDGGATFTQLVGEIISGGYTGTISTSFANPIAGQAAWVAGAFGDMTRVEVDLSAFAGTVGAVVRWRVGTDSCCGPGSAGGWQIDDVSLSAPTGCDGNLASVLFLNKVPSVPFFADDMESGAGPNWSHGAAVGIDDWAVGSTPYAHSPSNAWKCIDDLTYTDKYLDLTVDLNAPFTDLWFWHTYYFESGQYDGAIVQISADGGATFVQLDSEIYEGGYNGVIQCAFGNPLGCVPAWTQGGFGPMTQVKADLSAWNGTTGAIIRFRVGTDSCCGPGAGGGWQIDDVAIVNPGSSGTGDEDYTIDISQAAPFLMTIEEGPGAIGDGNPSKACVYAWIGAPGFGDIVNVPKQLGPMCFGPYIIRTKNPKKIWNAIGSPSKLGTNNMPNPPTIPDGTPFVLVSKPGGVGKVITATFQGVITDPCSKGTVPFSITNGLLVNLVP